MHNDIAQHLLSSNKKKIKKKILDPIEASGSYFFKLGECNYSSSLTVLPNDF